MGQAEQEKRARKVSLAMKRQRSQTRRLMVALLVFLAICASFMAGFFLRSQPDIMESLGFPVLDGQATSTDSSTGKTTFDSVSMRVSDVENLLADFSLDSVNLDEATSGMLTAMMQATDDPYAVYYDPDRYNSYIKETTDRSYAGIGVVFSEYNGRAYVADVFEGSEAEAKGVAAGDFVIGLDGDESHAWTMTEVVNFLAEHDGSSVVVSWMRPTSLDAETGLEYSTTLACKEYAEENVSTELRDNVGVIRVRQITANSTDLVRSAIESLSSQGAAGFVLDLRNNPGGYLSQAVDIASLLLKSGVVVEVQTNEGSSTKKVTGTTLTDAPVCVMVDEYTSAAAEVLAAALQDNQRAQVVGQTSAGKGSVQVTRELAWGGAVRYTAAYYLTPLGHQISGVGVVPDIMVSANESMDNQIIVAVDSVRSKIAS
ncbi:MAG: peptidase [Eggerthellaceae bacterium]|nr:peptidase [Eggerthellaceae bacterium]